MLHHRTELHQLYELDGGSDDTLISNKTFEAVDMAVLRICLEEDWMLQLANQVLHASTACGSRGADWLAGGLG